ncbi:MAG: hypothetical protein AB4060_14745 [Crocosphaera sp.]
MAKSYQNINQKVNAVIESVDITSSVPENGSYEAYGMRNGNHIVFSGNNKESLEQLIDLAWKQNPEVYETRSRERVKQQLIDLICSCINREVKSEKKDIENLFKRLVSFPAEQCEVFRPLYGAKLSSPLPIKLGIFTIYDFSKHSSLIYSKYPHPQDTQEYWRKLLLHNQENILISIQLRGRDSERIQERAEKYFYQFDNIIRYMLAEGNIRFIYFDRDERFDIAVFEHYQKSMYQSILLSSSTDRFHTDLKIKGAGRLFDMNLPVFTDQRKGHDIIWKIHSDSNPSEINKRVITAVEWIGKSLRDTDFARSFIQVMFALEALLTFREKGILISPSIASQLTEFAAFILGKNNETRSQIEIKIKKLYETRSSIVHSGNSKVSKQELIEAIYMIKGLIAHLKIDPQLSTFQSMKELQTWVKSKKYS